MANASNPNANKDQGFYVSIKIIQTSLEFLELERLSLSWRFSIRLRKPSIIGRQLSDTLMQ